MRAGQSGKPARWNPLLMWRRVPWRWKMTLAGTGIGIISAGMWMIPGAYYAFRGGYTSHGIFYVVGTTVLITVGMAFMHILGIRQEIELKCK